MLLSLSFLYFSFISSIHDGFRVAAALFPLPVLLSPEWDSITTLVIFLALIQWPLYALVGLVCFRKRRHPLSAVILCVLIMQHILIGVLSRHRVESVPIKFKLERNLTEEQRR